MNTTIIVIVAVIFFGLLGGGAFVVFKQLKKTDPRNEDSSLGLNSTSAQEFLPFKDIKDNMIDVGNHQYRAIVECSSTNYNLKTEREKEVIEASFQRFVNSLTHPIWFFIQTRTIDNTKMINKLEIELKETIAANPQMTEYANEFFMEMQNLSASIGNNKQKKKYVIVPYDDAVNMQELTEEEKYEFSIKEGIQRAYIVSSGLSSVGMKCKVLSTPELIELVYSSYHKDNYSDAEFLSSGEFTTMIVDGVNIEQNMSKDARLDHILYEAQMRIANEVAGRAETPEMKKDYDQVIKKLNQIRDESGAYYKK